eukprot:gene21903-28945_t
MRGLGAEGGPGGLSGTVNVDLDDQHSFSPEACVNINSASKSLHPPSDQEADSAHEEAAAGGTLRSAAPMWRVKNHYGHPVTPEEGYQPLARATIMAPPSPQSQMMDYHRGPGEPLGPPQANQRNEEQYSDDDEVVEVDSSLPPVAAVAEAAVVAARAAALGAHDESLLADLPWKFVITREARQNWASLPDWARKLVFQRCQLIGSGCWASSGLAKKIQGDSGDQHLRGMELYEDAIPAVQASYRRSLTVRDRRKLRLINLPPLASHPSASAEGHGRTGAGAVQRMPKYFRDLAYNASTEPSSQSATDASDTDGDLGGDKKGNSGGEAGLGGGQLAPPLELREHLPPASGAPDTYTLLKFYNLSSEVLRSVFRGLSDAQAVRRGMLITTYTLLKMYNLSSEVLRSVFRVFSDTQVDFPFKLYPQEQDIITKANYNFIGVDFPFKLYPQEQDIITKANYNFIGVDFPFKLSPQEQDIITMVNDPPASTILLGRSGTGKTTCAVYRIWAQWLQGYNRLLPGSEGPPNTVFVTASATLKAQVAKAFRRLQAPVMAPDKYEEVLQAPVMPPDKYEEVLLAGNMTYHTLRDVPPEAFPLFLSSRQWLHMLDGTLQQPFFPRGANGAILKGDGVDALDLDGMTVNVDLDYQVRGSLGGRGGAWGAEGGLGAEGGPEGNCQCGSELPGEGGLGADWRPGGLRATVNVDPYYQLRGSLGGRGGPGGNLGGRGGPGGLKGTVNVDLDYQVRGSLGGRGGPGGSLGAEGGPGVLKGTVDVDLDCQADDDNEEGGQEYYEDGEGWYDEEEDEQAEGEAEEEGDEDADEDQLPAGRVSVQKEVTYQYFLNVLWKEIANPERRKRLHPALEIVSYIKGSSEAMETHNGRLTVEQYVAVGAKRAPNFCSEERATTVYPMYELYERVKRKERRYDNMDLVSHIYRQLALTPYNGATIASLYRDEVQTEMLLDLRVASDPNTLFYSGDTAQTIARGIGFRFADIKTLFFHENKRRVELGGESAATRVAIPPILQLTTNYRTHQGVLNTAALLVDLIKEYFPLGIDKLQREKALFQGAPPLLLGSISSVDDMCILLSGSNKSTSQVEFGAHQVILVRTTESEAKLLDEIGYSNTIIMTVEFGAHQFILVRTTESEAKLLDEIRYSNTIIMTVPQANSWTGTYTTVEFGAHQFILVRTTESGAKLPDEIRYSKAIIMTVPQANPWTGTHTTVEFGAHQVILVRTTESEAKLPDEIRYSNAIIMTVPQAKGLEFDDVFIVDFFEDSEATSEWRVLSSFLAKLKWRLLSSFLYIVDFFEDSEATSEWRVLSSFLAKLKGANEDPSEETEELREAYSPKEVDVSSVEAGYVRPMEFDPKKHVLLSEELKHLYTAITRAKNNVVIFDRNIKHVPLSEELKHLYTAITRAKNNVVIFDRNIKHVLLSEELKHLYTAITRAKNNVVIFDRNIKHVPLSEELKHLYTAITRAKNNVVIFDRNIKHVLLSEELKHLYTAITRAKNKVVIFDKNMAKRYYYLLRSLGMARFVNKDLLKDRADATKAKRTPFYHLLRPLGMARFVNKGLLEDGADATTLAKRTPFYHLLRSLGMARFVNTGLLEDGVDVTKAKRTPFYHLLRSLGMARFVNKGLLEDGADATKFGLTTQKATSSTEEWGKRAQNLFLNGNYAMVRAQVADAYQKRTDAASQDSVAARRRLLRAAATQLLVAASRATDGPEAADDQQRMKWTRMEAGGPWLRHAAELYERLGTKPKLVYEIYIKMGDRRAAAVHCRSIWMKAVADCGVASSNLAAALNSKDTGEPAVVLLTRKLPWLSKAVEHFYGVKDYDAVLELLDSKHGAMARLGPLAEELMVSSMSRLGPLAEELTGEAVGWMAKNWREFSGAMTMIAFAMEAKKGNKDRAMVAIRLIPKAQEREGLMRKFGMWKNL